MEVEEPVLVEVGVDGHSHVVADAHHGSEGIGAQAQMAVLAHILKGLALLLHGIVAAAEAVDLELLALDFYSLAGTLALYQCTHGADAGSGGNVLEHLGVKLGRVDYHLDVLDGRTVVERNKIDSLAAAVGTHPSLYIYLFSEIGALEGIDYFSSFHLYL